MFTLFVSCVVRLVQSVTASRAQCRVACLKALLGLSVLVSPFVFAGDDPAPMHSDSYLLLPGDVLEISVWDEPSLQKEVLILPDSSLSFPLVGPLDTRGMDVADLIESLTSKLIAFIPNVSVSVAVKQLRGARVYVLGKVNRPGEILLDRQMTVLQALSVAGGLSTFADEDEIFVLRKDGRAQKALEVDYSAIVSGRELGSNFELSAGDILVVN